MLRLMALAPRPSFRDAAGGRGAVVGRPAGAHVRRPGRSRYPRCGDVAIPAPYGVLPAAPLPCAARRARTAGCWSTSTAAGWGGGATWTPPDNVCPLPSPVTPGSIGSLGGLPAWHRSTGSPRPVEDAPHGPFDFRGGPRGHPGRPPRRDRRGAATARGGNLAAVVCQLRTAGDRPRVPAAVLPGDRPCRGKARLGRAVLPRGYVPDRGAARLVPRPTTSPTRAERAGIPAPPRRCSPRTLTGLPPAYIATAGFRPATRRGGSGNGQRLRARPAYPSWYAGTSS